MKRYKDIFSKVENSLRKHSNLSETGLDSHFGKFKKFGYKNLTDEDIYWTMVYVAFYSGMKATTVTDRLPAIRRHLYDFRKVRSYSKEDVKKIMADPGTIHHKRKIEACIANAKEFDQVLNEHGAFAKYIESFGPIDGEATIDRLRVDLRGKFQYLGERTVNHFLTDLGLNVLKPDRVICRIFTRLGLIRDEKSLEEAIEVGRAIARATKLPIRYVDIIFVTYGQLGNLGICLEENPKCDVCGVKSYCRFLARKHR
jgi:DNA-3-methyladenine glycosylase I